jgi:hypothetical protein
MIKMAEDEVVLRLKSFLEEQGWSVDSRYCLGFTNGIDIEAHKGNQILMVEAKGARANDSAASRRREHFDSGQIKTHFGKAIVKILEDKFRNPNASFAIAHPDDTSRYQYKIDILPLSIPSLQGMAFQYYFLKWNKSPFAHRLKVDRC